jgi:hypothetical protein
MVLLRFSKMTSRLVSLEQADVEAQGQLAPMPLA